MFKGLTIAAAVAALTVGVVAPSAAEARDRGRGGYGHYDRGYHGGSYYRGGRSYYADRGYRGGRNYYRGGRCRDKGTTGTILGAIAGGLIGHEIGNGRYDNRDGTVGTVLGAGAGALVGRSIDRNC